MTAVFFPVIGHFICLTRTRNWDIPEKIHTSQTDGTLEILAGGGVEGSGNPGGRGGLDLKLFFGGHRKKCNRSFSDL